jgi:hypothetical protein
MGRKRRIAIVLMAAVLLAALAAGCGGGDSSASGTAENSPSTAKSESTAKSGSAPKPEPNTELGNRPGPGVVNFGEEADDEEREAISTLLEEHFDARAAGEWAKQCASMTFEQSEEVRETTVPNANCAKGLRIQATPLAQTQAFRANPMTGPIDAFRVEGELGYALFRGKDGKQYVVAMKKENGKWKVDDLIPTRLP